MSPSGNKDYVIVIILWRIKDLSQFVPVSSVVLQKQANQQSATIYCDEKPKQR